jgi:hypothetical protein
LLVTQPTASKRVECESNTVPTPDADGSRQLFAARSIHPIGLSDAGPLERFRQSVSGPGCPASAGLLLPFPNEKSDYARPETSAIRRSSTELSGRWQGCWSSISAVWPATTTTPSTEIPGLWTSRSGSACWVVTRSTCTTTIPAGFLVAWPIESESSVAGSRSHRHVAVLGGGCAA